MLTANLTLPTPDFGDAGFEVTVSERGEVVGVRSAVASLPETVFRLTYGERWEDARAYFQHLAENLRYQAAVAVWLTDPPAEFKLLRRAFRKTYPDAVVPTAQDELPLRRFAAWWRAHLSVLPALFRKKRAASAFRQLHRLLPMDKCPAGVFAEWLFSLLPLSGEVNFRRDIYTALALLDLPDATEFLFSELERSGRHPYAAALLRSLRNTDREAYRQRILALYRYLGDEELLMPAYLRLLHNLVGEDTHAVISRILDRHPAVAAEVLTALRATQHPHPEAVIRARFEEDLSFLLLDQLAELTATSPDLTVRVSLADMNDRIDRERFVTASPVTWPQTLWTYWTQLLNEAPDAEVVAMVERYLHRPEPILQRNALLQLKEWVSRRVAPSAATLSPAVEQRLRELIDSHIDKISTVAVDILRMAMDQLTDPVATVDALLAHSLVSRYRLMDFAALKQAARQPELRERQLSFYRRQITELATPEQLQRVKRTLPYLSYLGEKEALARALREREADLGPF